MPYGRADGMNGLVAPLVFAWVVGAQPVVPPIAPPKPAVPRAANAIVISTGDLNYWSLVRDAVRQQALGAADLVDEANAQVQAIVADPARPSPDQSEYLPALQHLQQIVIDVNTQLAHED